MGNVYLRLLLMGWRWGNEGVMLEVDLYARDLWHNTAQRLKQLDTVL